MDPPLTGTRAEISAMSYQTPRSPPQKLASWRGALKLRVHRRKSWRAGGAPPTALAFLGMSIIRATDHDRDLWPRLGLFFMTSARWCWSRSRRKAKAPLIVAPTLPRISGEKSHHPVGLACLFGPEEAPLHGHQAHPNG